MRVAKAFAKINLGLVVGPVRRDGKHEIVTVLQRVDLHDDVSLEPAPALAIEGFGGDTIVRAALVALAEEAGVEPRWRVRIEKRIPIAAGLGGGSADAAAALLLANSGLDEPVDAHGLHRIAARIGADVPFFLRDGAQFATGDGADLEPIDLPVDYNALLVVPPDREKRSTGAVYEAFDDRGGPARFEKRRAAFERALASIATARDLAQLPRNDLASSPLTEELRVAGAFRADVSGAGPTVYGLFEVAEDATRAAEAVSGSGRTHLTRPVPAMAR